MADPIVNRLEVDLKLLADKQFDFLRDFAKRWEDSVKTLEKVVNQLGKIGGGGVTGTGGGSTHASRAADVPKIIRRSHPAVNFSDWADEFGSGPSSAASTPFATSWASQFASKASTPGKVSRALRYGLKGDDFDFDSNNEFIEAQFRLGSVPRGAIGGLQYSAWLMGQMHGGDRSHRMYQPAQTMGLLAHRAVQGRAIYDTVKGVARQTGLYNLAPTVAQTRGYSKIGTSQGLSNQGGWLGTQYMSEAWRAGIRENWEGYKRGSWLSIKGVPVPFLQNPRYSRKEAGETEEAIRQYGWSAEPLSMREAKILQADPSDPKALNRVREVKMQDALRADFRHYTDKYDGLLTQDQLGQMYDPVMRGQADLEDLRQTLDGLGESADAANMELGAFIEQMLSVSSALSEKRGMTTVQTSKQVRALSAATGMTPKQLQPILENDMYYWMARGRGVEAIDMLTGDKSVTATFSEMERVLSPQIGSPEQWRRAKEQADAGNPAPLRALEVRAGNLYEMTEGALFGDMPYETWRDQMWLRDPRESAKKSQASIDARGATSEAELANALRAGGMSETQVRDFEKYADSQDWDMSERGNAGSAELESLYQAYNTEMGNKSATDSEYMITVDPKYAHIFKVVGQMGAEGTSLGSGNSNSQSFFGRASSGVESLHRKLGLR